MKRIVITLLLFFSPLLITASDLSIGGDVGYRSGLNLSLNGTISNLARSFPFMLRGGFSYTSLDPGNSAAARRIFINNATNGTPEKAGWIWDVRFDLLYPVNWFSLKDAYFYAGPRYALFTGNFNYIGGNENFDVTSDQWGLGVGLETHYTISRKFTLLVSGGLDYYTTDLLVGHDTSYGPDGERINGREDYNYNDADEAINQPTIEPRLLIGILYNLD